MNPFQYLGLKTSADVPEIKRAYASKLKKTRPEDDPVGFQSLYAAYQSALIAAAQRERWRQYKAAKAVEIMTTEACSDDMDGEFEGYEEYFSDVDESDELLIESNVDKELDSKVEQTDGRITAQATGLPAECRPNDNAHFDAQAELQQEHEVFYLAPFIDELVRQSEKDELTFKRWLEGHPDLYSIGLKLQIVEPILVSLHNLEKPLHPISLKHVADFFSLDTIHAGSHWQAMQMQELESRSEAYWRIEKVARLYQSQQKRPVERMLYRELKEPKASFWRRAFIMLFPGLAGRTLEIARLFKKGNGQINTTFIEQDNVDFWQRYLDKRKPSLLRILAVSLRLLLPAALIDIAIDANYDEPAIFLKMVSFPFLVWLGFLGIQSTVIRITAWSVSHNYHPQHIFSLPLIAMAGTCSLIDSSWTMILAMIFNLFAAACAISIDGISRFRASALILLVALNFSMFVMISPRLESWQLSGGYFELALIGLIPALCTGVLLLHDFYLMKRKNFSIEQVHEYQSSLWIMIMAALTLMFFSGVSA